MNEGRKQSGDVDETDFSREVKIQAARKRKAQSGEKRSIWFGLGVSGLIGWSVVVPTLIGAMLGVWFGQSLPESLFVDVDAATIGFGHRLP